ncbi:MAG: hypothetical protein ACI8UD_004410 [Planctomycetota bacterium]|jgi:hypothetical protein
MSTKRLSKLRYGPRRSSSSDLALRRLLLGRSWFVSAMRWRERSTVSMRFTIPAKLGLVARREVVIEACGRTLLVQLHRPS